MAINLKECVDYLLANGYAVVALDQFVVTKKLQDELFKREPNIHTPEPPQTIMPVKTVSPKSLIGKDLWNIFIADAEIPWRVTAPDGGVYTVRQFSPAMAKKLSTIINNPEIEYSILVESTKHYYKTVTYKALLSNYLEKDIWFGEYQEWKKNKGKTITPRNDGSNWAESL